MVVRLGSHRVVKLGLAGIEALHRALEALDLLAGGLALGVRDARTRWLARDDLYDVAWLPGDRPVIAELEPDLR